MSTVLAWPVFCLLGLEVFGQVSDALLWVPRAQPGEYWHPALSNSSQWPKDTRANPNQIWTMQPTNTWWPQNWAGHLLFKALTLALDIMLLCPSTIGGLGPSKSEIQLSNFLRQYFVLYFVLWRTLEEWCSTAKCSAHWWENAWMGGLATSQAEDEAGSSGTDLLTPVLFSWPWI